MSEKKLTITVNMLTGIESKLFTGEIKLKIGKHVNQHEAVFT